MAIPKHYSLVKEHDKSYEIHDSRDQRKFHISKAGLNLAMHGELAGIRKFASGGDVPEGDDTGDTITPEPSTGTGTGDINQDPRVIDAQDRLMDAPTASEVFAAREAGTAPLPGQEEPPLDQAGQELNPEDGTLLAANDARNPAEVAGTMDTHPPMTFSKAHEAGQDVGRALKKANNFIAEQHQAAAAQQQPAIQKVKDFAQGIKTELIFEDGQKHHLDFAKKPEIAPAQVPAAQPAAPAEPAPVKVTAPDPFDQYTSATNKANMELLGQVQAGANAQKKAQASIAEDLNTRNFLEHRIPTALDMYYSNAISNDEFAKAIMLRAIDPNRIFQSRTTPEKIGGALGLIFGGMGSGMTGQPNWAWLSVQNAIDRDIKAQEQDKSDVMNLWKMNHMALGSAIDATTKTRAMMDQAVLSKINEHVAANASPVIQATAAPIVAELKKNIALADFQTAVRHSLKYGQLANVDPVNVLMHLPDSPTRQKAVEETGRAKAWAASKANLMKAFDTIDAVNNPAYLAAHPIDGPKLVQSLKETQGAIVARETTNNMNQKEHEAFMNAFSDWMEGRGNRAIKRATLEGMIDAKREHGQTFRVLTGMDLNNFESTNGSHPSSAELTKQKEIQYIKQGATNKNPMVQENIRFLKKKYGIQ